VAPNEKRRINPSELRQSDLIRLINSTPAGQMVTEQFLRKLTNEGGFHVMDQNGRFNLYRVAAWLFDRVVDKYEVADERYERQKQISLERIREMSSAGRDIGEMPKPANMERRLACERSLKLYCETYKPETFNLKWSEDHLMVIDKLERATLEGGLFALAMPRGSGKSSLCEAACEWAINFGHHNYVALVGASEQHAEEMLTSIKTEYETNDLLTEDFPEICLPIQALEGITGRCAGQTSNGKRTRIQWKQKMVVFPTVEGSLASGALIQVAGITGRVRGMKHKRGDGQTVRPRLVIVDDPQTDDSARSNVQCQKREEVLSGAILNLSGPGQKMSGVMPCTVIREGDMAHNILDRQKHPDWQGETTKLMYSMPKNEVLWDEYASIRAECLRTDGDTKEATKFYRAHKDEMDEGALPAWPERYNHDELSAIQHAMNLLYKNEHAFFAEYQNDPIPPETDTQTILNPDEVCEKLNKLDHLCLPLNADRVTTFVDVQQKALFYVTMGFEEDFTGYVIDYGTWPDQKRRYYTLRDLRHTIEHMKPGVGIEAQIYNALEHLSLLLATREYRREDGSYERNKRILIDANWGVSTDVVYEFCRQTPFAGIISPTHGRFVGASSTPWSEYKKKPGEQVGFNWRVPSTRGKRAVPHVLYDTNFWKTFVSQRFASSFGDPGCFSVWGEKPATHRLFGDHMVSEYFVPTEGRNRKVNEWKIKPEHFDNHWFDGVVGCSVAASMLGCTFGSTGGGVIGGATQRKVVQIPQRRR